MRYVWIGCIVVMVSIYYGYVIGRNDGYKDGKEVTCK